MSLIAMQHTTVVPENAESRKAQKLSTCPYCCANANRLDSTWYFKCEGETRHTYHADDYDGIRQTDNTIYGNVEDNISVTPNYGKL